MSEHSVVAEFASAAVAKRMHKEVVAFLQKVAVEFDRAAAKAGAWPDSATPTAVAFGKKYGVVWDEPVTWGNDRLAGSEPAVATLDRALVLFHHDIAGGFGAELLQVLKKAGGKVRTAPRVPIVYGELPIRPATRAVVQKLTTWFAQRASGKELAQFSPPPWSRRRLSFGSAADVRFAVDDKACAFTVPLQPGELALLAAFMGRAGATLQLATAAHERSLAKREHAAAGASAKPAIASDANRPAAATVAATIPTKTPVVERTEIACSAMFSTGTALYALAGDGISVARGAGTPAHVKGVKIDASSVFVDGDELWLAGAGLWRSSNGGRSVTNVKLPPGVDPTFWGKGFHGVAKDPSGVVWVGGTWVVTVRDGKVVHEKSFGDDARIKAVVATPYGALLLTFAGTAFLARDGKAERLPVRGKGHLSAACVTPRGTILIVGSGATWSAEIYRSEDRGATFKPVRVAKLAPLLAVAALPDGRLVAGGGTLLISSTDDGKTWKPVATPKETTFELLCRHGDTILGDRVRIR